MDAEARFQTRISLVTQKLMPICPSLNSATYNSRFCSFDDGLDIVCRRPCMPKLDYKLTFFRDTKVNANMSES